MLKDEMLKLVLVQACLLRLALCEWRARAQMLNLNKRVLLYYLPLFSLDLTKKQTKQTHQQMMKTMVRIYNSQKWNIMKYYQ
jgi:hypothetical protein